MSPLSIRHATAGDWHALTISRHSFELPATQLTQWACALVLILWDVGLPQLCWNFTARAEMPDFERHIYALISSGYGSLHNKHFMRYGDMLTLIYLIRIYCSNLNMMYTRGAHCKSWSSCLLPMLADQVDKYRESMCANKYNYQRLPYKLCRVTDTKQYSQVSAEKWCWILLRLWRLSLSVPNVYSRQLVL